MVLRSQSINDSARKAVAAVVENPENLTTYSWREVLPTLALKLQFTAPQRISLSDWQDPSLASRGGEAPITLRYAQDKRTLSRESKMRCFNVLTILRRQNVATLLSLIHI